MPFSLHAPILAAVALVAGLGCSAPVVDDVADANGGMTESVVLVERIAAGDGSTQTNVSAKFMRLGPSADPDMAERLVGSRLDLPGVGECTTEAADDAAALAAGKAAYPPIELLDVGDLTLHAGATAMPLATRAFPDVGALVSGVFYTSRDAASDLPASAKYVLEGSGSLAVERFSITADAPAAPDDVRVGGGALADGVTLEEGAPAQVRWRRAAAPSRDDLILVDVSAASGKVVRCAFADTGEATVPGSRLSLDGGTLAVHRIRQRTFGTSGIDLGEIRFDLAVIGRVTVAPRAF
jgi:hypothetical protein